MTTRRTSPTTRKAATSTAKKPQEQPAVSKTEPKVTATEEKATSTSQETAPEQPKSAEEIINESAELKSKIEKLGSYKVLKKLKKAAQETSLKPFQAELILMQKYLEETKRSMIILFEGRDASGKGGTIRRVSRYMNEKHYRVVALGKPTDAQRTQWFFQRYVEHFPRGGEVVLFDRSWYNRAMVEPVFGFCTPEENKVFMRGVVGFERDLVRQGTILVKLYFSVTKEEQANRFQRRQDDPLRQWKLSEVDLQAQERWDDFTNQKYAMLKKTHSSHAPWTVIRSNNKHAARLNAMRTILNSVPYERKNTEIDFVPNPDVLISGSREVEQMEAVRIRMGKFTH
ncbi:MAG: polyphosphate kinase 2 [Gammaproteobacteria bacterium]|nr:polyphosphate kinase 2 [Gammaproteobacteria bacterium]